MISQALRHCRGIGPARLTQLNEAGILNWIDVLERTSSIPHGLRANMLSEAERCLGAILCRNVDYFVERLAPQDRWRIAAHFLNEMSFFDIETTGLDYDASVTVITCWHRGGLRTFVEHENLDEFLVLLDEVHLLASFNGSTFDVPRILDTFHIPELPCAHLDLRWAFHHLGFTGGLKRIARQLGIHRPDDLYDADGAMAVDLWNRWRFEHDAAAREQLIRYCASDVLMLVMMANGLAERDVQGELWGQLPLASEHSAPTHEPKPPARRGTFGAASPSRLRARRRLAI